MVEDLEENTVEVRNARALLTDHIKVIQSFQLILIETSIDIETKRNSNSTRRCRSSIKIR